MGTAQEGPPAAVLGQRGTCVPSLVTGTILTEGRPGGLSVTAARRHTLSLSLGPRAALSWEDQSLYQAPGRGGHTMGRV